jgi:anti-anti-sigma factor
MAFERLRVEVPFDALDLSTVDEFTDWYRTLLSSGATGAGDIVLDFAGVGLVAAAGVRMLCDLEAELLARGGRLAITGAVPIVVRVLQICDVAERWTP